MSDDEETQRRRAKAPAWSHGQGLQDALEAQASIDPDEIFGVPTGEVPLEEIFPRVRRRPRSSSANWTGTDALAQWEIDRYNLRLGIKTNNESK